MGGRLCLDAPTYTSLAGVWLIPRVAMGRCVRYAVTAVQALVNRGALVIRSSPSCGDRQ